MSAPSILPIWRSEGYKPLLTGNFFIDHLGFFAARRGAVLRLEHPSGLPGRGTIQVGKQQEVVDQLQKEREKIDQGEAALLRKSEARAPLLTRSRRVITRLLSNMTSRDVSVVFVADPELPSRSEVYADRVERFNAEMSELVSSYGAHYWNFNDELDLQDSDFQDRIHLGSDSARRKFQALLMARLGDLIRERFGGGFGGASASGMQN